MEVLFTIPKIKVHTRSTTVRVSLLVSDSIAFFYPVDLEAIGFSLGGIKTECSEDERELLQDLRRQMRKLSPKELLLHKWFDSLKVCRISYKVLPSHSF